jgi:hypothetical protein
MPFATSVFATAFRSNSGPTVMTWEAMTSRDGALDLTGIAHVERAHIHPERRCHGLDDAKQAGAGG